MTVIQARHDQVRRIIPEQLEPAEQIHGTGRPFLEPARLAEELQGNLPPFAVADFREPFCSPRHRCLQLPPGIGIVNSRPIRRLRQVEAARREQPGKRGGWPCRKGFRDQHRPQFGNAF